MSALDGNVTTLIQLVNGVFVFSEEESDTDAVVVEERLRLFQVEDAGSYQLTFNSQGFDFAANPIGFPDGQPGWITLNTEPPASGATFSVTVANSGTVENQTVKFLIHSAAEDGVVDPTVVNNPNPPTVMRPGRHGQAGAGARARQHAART